MRDIFQLVLTTAICQEDSYIISYPFIISYMHDAIVIGAKELILGTHMVYGWMPTALELHPGDGNISLQQGADLLQKARDENQLSECELTKLSKLVNNSLVGASKLLHFVAPENFAIWDSKIYAFIHERIPYNYRVNKPKRYLDYLSILRRITQNEGFQEFHQAVNRKIGYDVTAFRAIELIMFMNSPARWLAQRLTQARTRHARLTF